MATYARHRRRNGLSCRRPAERPWAAKGAKGSGTKPRRRSLRVTQRGRLPRPSGQREPRGALGQLTVAERDQDRESVQPRPVQLAERRRELAVVGLRDGRLQDGRRTPPW